MLLGPRHVRRRRLADPQFQLLLGDGERHVPAVLDGVVGLLRGPRDRLGDEPAAARPACRLQRGGLAEVDVVHVPAGAVRQDADEVRRPPRSACRSGRRTRRSSRPTAAAGRRRSAASSSPAAPAACRRRSGPTAPTRPGRSARPVRARPGFWWPGFIFTWSVVLPNGSGFATPSFIFHRRLNSCDGSCATPHPTSAGARLACAFSIPSAIFAVRNFDVARVRVALEHAGDGRGGVRVRRRDEHVRRRDAGLRRGPRLRLVDQLAGDHAAIDDDDGELRLAVVEDQAAGVQRVVGLRRLAVGHPAVDRDGELLRGDVHGERPGPQSRLLGSSPRDRRGGRVR